MVKLLSKKIVNLYSITERDYNQRLDNLLSKLYKDVPKNHLFKIIRNGEVRVNAKRVAINYKVQLNDIVRIPPIVTKDKTDDIKTYVPTADFPILFEDDYYLIIDKPSGIACHGGSGINFGVIEQLRQTYSNLKFLELAHRLDKGTSGVLILAKKRQALVQLQEIIKTGAMKKIYIALTYHPWVEQHKQVKLPLYKYLNKDGERRVRVDHVNGQQAHTIFKVIETFIDSTLVYAQLKTGRTHQIRVHLQQIGHCIVGDDKYGDFEKNKQFAKDGCKRMFLHANQVTFTHPITQQQIDIQSPLPQQLQQYINKKKETK